LHLLVIAEILEALVGTITGQLISGFASLLSTVFQNLLQVLKSPAGGIIYALLAARGDFEREPHLEQGFWSVHIRWVPAMLL
jgi:hypothetical protein